MSRTFREKQRQQISTWIQKSWSPSLKIVEIHSSMHIFFFVTMNNFPQILLGVVVGALGHQVLGDFQVPRIKSFRKALARKAPQQRGTDDEVVDQNETVNPTPKDDEEVPVESAPKNISKPLNFDDPEVCRKILACENYGEGENLLTNLASRAKPNQRLVRAFEIDNAFATEDKGRKIKFRNEVKSKIQGVNWPSVSNEARSVISNYLQGRNRGSPVRDLGDLVRFVCLRITIFTLFKRDQNELDDADIEDLTSSINDLWAESKAGGEPAESNKTNSQKAMRSVFPKMESGPGKNDLNFILPAYETLWRVVLSCLIEVKFRPGADPEWRRQLTEFYHKKADETSDKKQIQSDKSKITGADVMQSESDKPKTGATDK